MGATFEGLRSWRQVSLLERGTAYDAKSLHSSELASSSMIRTIGHRLLYLKLISFVVAFLTLNSKKVKRRAIQARNAYWAVEADSLEKTWREGRFRDIHTMARIYGDKRAPARI